MRADEEEANYQQDCPGMVYVPTILGKIPRVIAIGDLHGDPFLAKRCLQICGLADREGDWIPPAVETAVVVLGDLIDSWRPGRPMGMEDSTDDAEVYRYMMKVHSQAKENGGVVYLLLGNHEIMNARADFRYVTEKNSTDWEWEGHRGLRGRQEAYRPGGSMAKELACESKAVLVIGSTLFAHAGVLPDATQLLQMEGRDALRELNYLVRRWLLDRVDADRAKTTEHVIDHPESSPFWQRVYGQIKRDQPMESKACTELREALQVYQLDHMIIGHTPQIVHGKPHINGTCYIQNEQDHRLYRIDGGLSEAFQHFTRDHDTVQILEILDDREFHIIRKPRYPKNSFDR